MNPDAIEQLVRRLQAANITHLEAADERSKLTLRLTPATGTEPGRTEAAAGARTVDAGAIGHLCLRHPEAADAPTMPRDVAAGEIVAYLRAGPMLRPVVAGQAGTLGDPLAPEGSLIGYGTPIFPYL